MKTIFKIGVLILISLGTACKEEKYTVRMPVKVKVTSGANNISPSDSYSGTVEEEIGTSLSFQVPGTIEQIPVQVGQYVKAGQLIASVNPATMHNTYEAALATLTQARDAYERMRQLHERGSIPEIQWVEVQSRLRQAESSERIAKKNLQDCRLTAPYAGVIISKEVEQGQSAMPGMPVVKLGRIGDVKISISVPESELGSISVGTPAHVEIPALSSSVFDGTVAEKGITANPVSHTYDVKILVHNREAKLMPGMVAKVTLATPTQATPTMVLPGNCIGIDERNRKFVWVVSGGTAHRRFIECGRPQDAGVEVLSGVVATDSIIVEGQQKVSEGMRVEITR